MFTRILKVTVILVAVLVVVIGLCGWMVARTGNSLHARILPAVPAAEMGALVGDAERGKHLASSRGCADCHGADLGGHAFITSGAMGTIVGNNLTPSEMGLGPNATYAQFEAAVRHGVAVAGHPVFLMPSQDYWYFSDQEVADLWAYVRSLPAVDVKPAPTTLGPVAKILLGTGKLKLAYDVIDHQAQRPEVPEKAATVAYGKHLASLSCIGCHGKDLSGGPIPGGDPKWPAASDLRNVTGIGYDEAKFITAIRTGRRADGRDNDLAMPRSFGALDDTELSALWAYLTSSDR